MIDERMSTSEKIYQKYFLEAFRNGDLEELQKLLENRDGKINVNLYDKEGQTPLHIGAMKGDLKLVKLLVKNGADTKLANRDGWSALHIAAYGGHQDIILYLVAASRTSLTPKR